MKQGNYSLIPTYIIENIVRIVESNVNKTKYQCHCWKLSPSAFMVIAFIFSPM